MRSFRYGGTALDAKLRAAVNDLRSLRGALERAEAHLARARAHGEAEVVRLTAEVAAAQAKADELMGIKLDTEPGTVVAGLKRPAIPPGITPEEWVAMRQAGTHLQYLRKVY
jgi:hypothetical protein